MVRQEDVFAGVLMGIAAVVFITLLARWMGGYAHWDVLAYVNTMAIIYVLMFGKGKE